MVSKRGSKPYREQQRERLARLRPSVRVPKTLATIYKTTWDQLVDIDDLEKIPISEWQEFLDISDLRYGDSLDLPAPWRSRHHRNAPHGGDDSPMNWPVTAEEPVAVDEQLLVPSPVLSLERPGGGLPGEVTHFTGRDGPMAELRDRIAEQGPQGTVVTIYAIDGMAGVGKTAFARHAVQELARNYPEGTIWVDLYRNTPGMLARDPPACWNRCCAN